MDAPVFSWTVEESEGGFAWASIEIFKGTERVWDTGKAPDANSLGWKVDLHLEPRTRYTYKLTVCTDRIEVVSAEGWFETGKRNEEWTAKWITPQNRNNAILRKTFTVTDSGTSARLYICGLGVYEAYINGAKVGDEYLAPGYHSYDFHLAAQTYDVTGMLNDGENTIEIWLGEGWFKGRLGFEGGYTDLYGDRLHAIAELYSDNDCIVRTDADWDEYTSPITFANIYDGEVFDARMTPEFIGKAELSAPEN